VKSNEKEELALWLNETCGIAEEVTDEMAKCYRHCLSFGLWRAGRALKDFRVACEDVATDTKENTRRFLERVIR